MTQPQAADDRKTRLDAVALLLIVGCCLIWGLNQVVTKVALAEVPPLTQAALRSLGAAVLVALWCRWRGVVLWRRDGTGRAGLLAGLLFAAEFGCIFVGLQYTSASRMVVFIYLAPFVVALGMPLIARHERLRAPQLVGLMLAFAGVVWAFGEGFDAPTSGPQQWWGDALGIAGAVLWGATTLVLRGSRLSRAAPEQALQYQLVVSGLALAAAAWVAGERTALPLSTQAVSLMGFQIVVVTFASYLTWFWLIRHYPATLLSVFTLLTPVFGLLAGVLLLHEPATPRLLLALGAVALGIALVNRAGQPRS